MNTIELDILSPHWVEELEYGRKYIDEPSLSIKIDGIDLFTMDEFKDNYEGATPSSFLYNEYRNYGSPYRSVFRGLRLIGVCGCRWEGCDDLVARVTSDEIITKWVIIPVNTDNKKIKYCFNAKEYKEQIEKLEKDYLSFSWEDNACKIRRLCDEYVKYYVTKDFKVIDGVSILSFLDKEDELSDTMEVYYYGDFEKMGEGFGRPCRSMEIKWDGKTLESALFNLNNFARENLIKLNENEINKLEKERDEKLTKFLLKYGLGLESAKLIYFKL